MENRENRFAIVGAGPNGLIAARAFRRAGLDIDILERHDAVGGIWNIDNPHSPVYESCNFISDRVSSAMVGYPMPDGVPVFPTWHEVRDFMHAFARDNGLDEFVVTGKEVIEARPIDTAAGQRWIVKTADGVETLYRGVVWACGLQSSPYRPEIRGLEGFAGEVIHSSNYKRIDQVVGKRVLVIGAGNSGVDIVVDAAIAGSMAHLSVRRGYHFFPKLIFGQPILQVLSRTAKVPQAVTPLSELTDAEAMQLTLESVGDLTSFGLPKPDHEPGATHWVMNDQVLYQIAHGHLQAHQDVQSVDGKTVHFADGTSAEVDLIILATGYQFDIPWLDPKLLDWEQGAPKFHLGALSSKVEGLYAAGAVHFPGLTYLTWDRLIQVAVWDAKRLMTGEGQEFRDEIMSYDPVLKNDNLIATHRNINQYDMGKLIDMTEELQKRYGIEMPSSAADDFYNRAPVKMLDTVAD
ncbi:NAD(P)/FAD-dependent oxidoreductase [Rhodococcus sp. Eu-32]|uniref:flavin-containing monooxygenase n=1 Tax=Rhodococcus sp. Eu-32 TaxID=1017319 RepID=UPI000DF427BC|nr:NAD(P)/FAD-dependent oxidoreductase [Rhodococcus sp. Eu-32]RRQ25311.1 NAD(P)/FAD-dependent oxidoreductase [Rhodococcus sp. Eu-32]